MVKILIVETGGTISCENINGTVTLTAATTNTLIKNWQGENTESAEAVKFSRTSPFFGASENFNGRNISLLIRCVLENAENFDGIIITHGTDTVQFTAAALSFAVGLNSKPVLIVSSNAPINDPAFSNGQVNFNTAVNFIINKRGRGVFVPYADSDGEINIHRGTRLLEHEEFSHCLKSVLNEPYIRIENGKETAGKCSEIADETPPFGMVNLGEHCPVRVIHQAVGTNYPKCENEIIIIKAYHSGTLPTDDPALTTLAKNNTVFVSDFDKALTYESSLKYEEIGIKPLPRATFISMYMKAWMAKCAGLDPHDVLYKSLGGDIICD